MRTKAPDSLKVGTPVYRVCLPKHVGKVIGLREEGTQCQVLWLSGEESWIKTEQLRDLRTLIDDHKKKIKEHEATIARLERL